MKISTLIFDVNETLLDLGPVKKSINNALESEQAAEVWFSQLLHYSLVESITGSYHDFSKIAAAVFKMNAEKEQKNFTEEEITEILGSITRLEAYPEVFKGLTRLKKAGYKLIAFSNGKPSVLEEQLSFSGLEVLFEQVLSVEGAQRYKPHPDSYKYALRCAESNAEDSLMIAAHAWDITGAQRAGLKTAFVQRKGKSLFPLAASPDMVVKDIQSLADKLLA